MQATRDCPLCKIQWPTPHTSGFFWAHIGGFFWELQCCINPALDTVGYEVEAPGSIPRAKIQRQNCLQITSMIKSGDNFGSYPFCYGSVYQIWSSVRGTPDSTPEIKISRCHHNRDVLADNWITSLVCVLRHFSSLRPHWVLWVAIVERLSSWLYVVLPCWLIIRHPSRLEPEMPINGGVLRLFLYSWARPWCLHAACTPRP